MLSSAVVLPCVGPQDSRADGVATGGESECTHTGGDQPRPTSASFWNEVPLPTRKKAIETIRDIRAHLKNAVNE